MAGLNPSKAAPVENYRPLLGLGIGLTLLLFMGLGLYWSGDGGRLTAAAAELTESRVERGAALYGAQCAACHGQQGEGGVGPALNNREVLKNTPDSIFFSVIRSGVPNTKMPSWSVDYGGPLTDEEIRDVVAFLRAWEPTAPEIVPAARQPDPNQGALLFSSTCAMCHGENGLGGRTGIPAINDPDHLRRFEDAWYRQTIANGRPAKGMPTWGTVLSPAQIDDLVALIGAWREGKTVTPSYSVTKLIEQALFAISQDDLASAGLVVSRALQITTGPAANALQTALGQLQAGDRSGAQRTLQTLQAEWPLGDPAAGEKVYAGQCAVCHGPSGEGGVGKGLHPNSFVQAQTNAQLVEFIQTGRTGTAMAGFMDRLAEGDIANLVAFLRTWQR